MKIELELLNLGEIYQLYIILGNQKNEYEQENHKHKDMINLLAGNDGNPDAINRLKLEKHCLKINNERIKMIDNIMGQLEKLY